MTPTEILAGPPVLLSQAQKEFYFEHGYVFLERLLPKALVDEACRAMAEFVERSRGLAQSTDDFVLEPSHSSTMPRLRRLNRATDQHPVFWELASRSALTSAVADVVGPDVKFRESYINFKWAKGGDAVAWHQDLPFYPHTNLALVTTLTYLGDCGADQGPLMVVPESHKGEVFDHYDARGRWAARIGDEDLPRAGLDRAVPLYGPAGSVILMDSRTVHGSRANHASAARPLLINGYAAADALPYFRQAPSMTSRYEGAIVRGRAARFAHLEAMRMRIPPDWSGGYTSIFEDQKNEARKAG